MGNISEKLDKLAEAIKNLDPYANPVVRITEAYHRFNEDCTQEEAEWILKYCDRHGIRRGNFKLNNDIDELM